MATSGETKTSEPESTVNNGAVEEDGGRQETTASPSGQNGQFTTMATPGGTKTSQPESTGNNGAVKQDGDMQETTESPSGQNGQFTTATPGETETSEPESTRNNDAVEQDGDMQETTANPSGENVQNTQTTQATSTQTGGDGETQASSEGKRPSPEEVRAWWKTVLDTFNCCYKGVNTSLDIAHEVEN